MNLRQIEAFEAVMEHGTVTKAAATLHISQPAVSRLIAYLERSCGYSLFVRRFGRLIATPEADLLHAEIKRVFTKVSDLKRVAADIGALRHGQLSIAAFPGVALRLLPDAVIGFTQLHPGVRIRLDTKSSREVLDSVAAQNADLGISTFAVDHPAIRRGSCFRWKGVCVMPRDHRLASHATIRPAMLRNEPFVSLGSEDRSRLPIDRIFEDHGVARHIAVEASLAETVCSLVQGGAGIAIVDELSFAGFTGGDLVCRPFLPRVWFDAWLVYPAHRQASRMTEAFAGALEQMLARKGAKRQATRRAESASSQRER